ncbi:MAG: N-6 DNA methylase [Leptospiraceae bacterium]|nr:N-6 DNA methylase [Leptospiraceae bacterium]
MITGELKNTVDKLWTEFWTGGVTNPVTVIEQIIYLLFLKQLDAKETSLEIKARRTSGKVNFIFGEKKKHLRWSQFKNKEAESMFKLVRDEVFPFIREFSENSNEIEFAGLMSQANLEIKKPTLLAKTVETVDKIDLSNSDTSGDLFEYVLSKLQTSGINGQFRSPRHIIQMMVEIMEPDAKTKMCDPTCGTAGFIVETLRYLLKKYTSEEAVTVDENGVSHYVGDKFTKEERQHFEKHCFSGFDFDQTMLKISSMNLWLHGIENPHIRYSDTLSKLFTLAEEYDLILTNPPFKGTLAESDINPNLTTETSTKKTELLFLILFLRLLKIGGRAAVIVPDGVLFGTSNAHVTVRKLLIDKNQLEGVISMPSGVFKPYAGVSTAILIFTKGGQTDKIWFYDMEHDGFSLDDKRNPQEENDIPDILESWKHKDDKKFLTKRENRRNALRTELEPLKKELLKQEATINKLTYESVIVSDENESEKKRIELEKAKEKIESLKEQIHHLQKEFNKLSRQFFVHKKDLVKYDLSCSRYRVVEQDEEYYEKPTVTLKRMEELDNAILSRVRELEKMI